MRLLFEDDFADDEGLDDVEVENENQEVTLDLIYAELKEIKEDLQEIKERLETNQERNSFLGEGLGGHASPLMTQSPIIPHSFDGGDVMDMMFDGQRSGALGVPQQSQSFAPSPLFSGVEMVDVNIPALNENI